MKNFSIQILFFLVFGIFCGSPAEARQSPQEKAAARSAFWGLFADTYLSLTCFERGYNVSECVNKRLTNTSRYSSNVDLAAAKSGLRFTPKITLIKHNLGLGHLNQVKRDLEELHLQLIEHFAAATAPAIVPDLEKGFQKYSEHCASCHGSSEGLPGVLSEKLKTPPEPLRAEWRANVQSPLGLYALLIHGVDGSEMLPLVDVLDIAELWSIAFYVSTFTTQDDLTEAGTEFSNWLNDHANSFSLVDLARLSDFKLASRIHELGRDCGLCSKELGYLRRNWLASAPRLGDYAKNERQSREARGLTILISLIAATSIGFGVILGRRARHK
jgi:mono/diheme cytochrome c family protein